MAHASGSVAGSQQSLLGGTRVVNFVFVTWLEQQQTARLHFYYDLALDYFYWLVVAAALSEQPNGHRLTSWRGQVVKLSQVAHFVAAANPLRFDCGRRL